MKSKVFRTLLLAVLGVFALSLTARADTLEMRDGRLIDGKFLGGSEFHIRFLVDGKEQVFDTKDVLNLSFSATAVNDSQPAVSQPSATAAPAGQAITVPAGTSILVRMIDSIDSSQNQVGDVFHASLADPLVIGDTVVAPKDADVVGRLSQAKSAGKIAGRSELRLELTGITIDGQLHSIVTSDYEVAGKSRGKQSAERIGGGAAIGAIIGAIAGGGKGAAIGAGVGAGAGTGVQILTHGEKVKVPSETLLEFKLDQPFTVVPASSTGQ
jgi:hypothetical protein